jgi:hypothetical protein
MSIPARSKKDLFRKQQIEWIKIGAIWGIMLPGLAYIDFMYKNPIIYTVYIAVCYFAIKLTLKIRGHSAKLSADYKLMQQLEGIDSNMRVFSQFKVEAAKEGVSSTGNGIRGSFKGTPEVGTTNFYIKPGSITQEELIKDISKGLYVTEVMGIHTANPISGDFSVGAAGLLIENGVLTTPVRGIAIAGNIIELLESVDLAANDLTFFVGRGSPTLRIAKMTISGS